MLRVHIERCSIRNGISNITKPGRLEGGKQVSNLSSNNSMLHCHRKRMKGNRMKGRSTFHILVLLVVLLTFSSHSVLGRARPTKPKVERKQSPIEIQAKQDAKNDVNKFAWFTAGLIGCASAWTMIELMDRGYIDPENRLGLLRCLIVAIPPFLPIVYAKSASSAPPTERLLGKSPEYVNAYVDSYAKEIKDQRVTLILTGWAASLVPAGMMSYEAGPSSCSSYGN